MIRYLVVLFTAICSIQMNLLGESMESPEATPEYLYKVVSPEDWQESQNKKTVVLTPMDSEFIHLSKEDQINHVVNKFWVNKQPVILKLQTKKLIGRLVYETNPGGTTRYYHLYEGSIPLDAVVDEKGQQR